MPISDPSKVRKVIEFYGAYTGGEIPSEYYLALACLARYYFLRFPRGGKRSNHAKVVSDSVPSTDDLVFRVSMIYSDPDTRYSEDPSIQLALDVLAEAERTVINDDLDIFLNI